MIKIVLIEDQTILLDSLELSLNNEEDFEVIGKSSRTSDAYPLCEALSPDILLMDICTDCPENGISTTVKIKNTMPEIKVMLMTAMPEITFADAARAAGADSFIYKNESSGVLFNTIRSTAHGYGTFPTSVQKGIPVNEKLNKREIAVLKLVCELQERSEIAEKLHISESTVKNIISSLLSKTGYDSISKLAIYAMRNGYILPD